MSTDANRTIIGVIDEASFNVVPTNPAFLTTRIRSVAPTFTPVTKTSQILDATRNISDLIRVGIQAGISLTMELCYGIDIHQILRAGMMSDWIRWPVRDNFGTAASVITAVNGAGVYTVVTSANPGTDQNDKPFAAGMLVNFTGFGVAANNQLAVATAGGATSVTVATSSVEASPAAAAKIKVVGIQGASGDITATGGGTNSIGTTLLNFTTLGFVPGQWIWVGGTAAGNKFATAANKDWCRISAVTTTQLTLDVVPAGWTTDTGAGKTIQIFVGDVIRNGTTARSQSLEVQYSDLEPEYDVYSGLRAGWEFSGAAQDIMMLTATYQGCNATNSTSRTAGASSVAAPTTAVMNTSSHIGELRVNGVQLGAGPNYVDQISIKLDNNLRPVKAIGSLYNVAIGLGQANVTGSLSMLYGDNTVRALLLANTGLSYSCAFMDPTLQAAYHLDVPNLKLVSGTPTIPGINTDRKLVTPFQGLKHAVLGYAVQVSRYDYLPL